MEDKIWTYWDNLSEEEKTNRLAEGLDIAKLCKEALPKAHFDIMLANFQSCKSLNNFEDCIFIKICNIFKTKYNLSRVSTFDEPNNIDIFED